jgi:hypothetical protein
MTLPVPPLPRSLVRVIWSLVEYWGEVDDHVEPLCLGDLDAVVGDRPFQQALVAADLDERRPAPGLGVKRQLVAAGVGGVLATFDRPGRAIRCVTALRARLRGMGVEIRFRLRA